MDYEFAVNTEMSGTFHVDDGVLTIIGKGNPKIFSKSIPILVLFDVDEDGLKAVLGLDIFVEASLTFDEPSMIQIGFDFTQSIESVEISNFRLKAFDVGPPIFHAEILKVTGGKACGKVLVRPEAAATLKFDRSFGPVDVSLVVDDHIGVEGSVNACAELNVNTPTCLSFRGTVDGEIAGVAHTERTLSIDFPPNPFIDDVKEKFLKEWRSDPPFALKERFFDKNVILNDVNPVITCPPNITASTDPNQCSAAINPGVATATDNCPDVTVKGKRSDGLSLNSPYPVGTTTITWTATDIGDNSVSCQQRVTVRDTQLPQISCPANKTMMTAKIGDTSAVVDYPMPTATDNCPGVTVSCTPPSGSSFRPGTTEVICKAADVVGNMSTCSFTVTVFDVGLQDDDTGDTLMFNSFTGDYKYTRCSDGMVATGKGRITRKGCLLILKDGSRVTAELGSCMTNSSRGSATLQFATLGPACSITDSNIFNNTNSCP